ncbi:hypothetical protein [Ferrimonas lipolytica]|uniref:Uncharacterized protein n=1 Tax=Ferrimonas lipolytica TaxID=2724191 RepID=A0A6H1UBE7_9GAMM|nr:hypothetical protein [Ferrimonas lipolytica]QIZ75969.1 hypothetical protein HER31_03165 [Ferrimonas lipolytica]
MERTMHLKAIRLGFYAAGIINIGGILLFSKALTNEVLMQSDPQTFSLLGCLTIMLWGAAYLVTAKAVTQAPLIALVFALEKMAYTVVWVTWVWRYGDTLPILYDQDTMAGLFYMIYGINDALFAVFFVLTFNHLRKQARLSSNIT